MQHLVDQSLVQRVPQAEPARFTLLETVRAFAWDALHAHHEAERAHTAHAAFFLALAETAQANITTAQRPHFAQQLDLDNENLQAALHWYQTTDAVEEGLRLAAALQWFWTMRGRFAEGRTWVETFLERDRLLGQRADPAVRARALSAAGRLALNQSDYAQSAAYEQAALDIFTQLHDLQRQALCWNGLALAAEKQSHFDAAAAAYQNALALYTAIDARFYMGTTTMNLGNVAFLRGDLDEAAVYYERGISFLRESGDPQALAMAQGNFASLLIEHENYQRGIQVYQEILEIFRQLDDHVHLALTQRNLGQAYYRQGALTEAETLTTAALQGERQMQHQRGIAESLDQLGAIFYEQGRLDDALAACSESLLILARIESGRGIVSVLLGLARIVLAQGASTEAVYLLAAATTLAQTLNMQIFPIQQTYADAVRTQALAALGADRFAAAWEVGAAWSTTDAIAAVQRYLDA